LVLPRSEPVDQTGDERRPGVGIGWRQADGPHQQRAKAEHETEAGDDFGIDVVDDVARGLAEPDELGKELRGRLMGLWSCRVGSYRILYTIDRKRVIVRAIRHRAVAYRRRRRQ